jgi:DNA-binding transcriptional regulator YhcF (GntR family)
VLSIIGSSSIPKYIQIINGIQKDIEEGKLSRGDKIPSINEVAGKMHLARGTVTKAYIELQNRGILASRHGKGFYIVSTAIQSKLNIFLLFDTLNAYKETLYQAFRQAIGENATLTIFFHHNNLTLFENLIKNNLGSYSYYVIMPHFNEDVSAIVKLIPSDKLLIIDKELVHSNDAYASIYQPFEKDIIHGLTSGLDLLQRYSRLNLVLSSDSFQFIPEGIISGFKKFCEDQAINYRILNILSVNNILPGEVFIVFTDFDLIRIINYAQTNHLQVGKDIGIISYDDTPIKSVLEKGITVLSTDFTAMGKKAAEIILSRKIEKIENASALIRRNSL